jgi:threonine/homoserine/homoserine lactone efflux protein
MTAALVGMICAMSMMPGTSTTVILDTTWTFGRKLGFVTALGGSAGVAIYTLLALFTGTYLSGHGMWINILEGAGALYLATLGVMALIEAFTIRHKEGDAVTSTRGLRAFLNGTLSTCLSPKTALFYLVILTQHDFGTIPVVQGILLAGFTHICFRLVWYGAWIHLIDPLRCALKTLWMQRAMKLTTAMLLLGLSFYVVH